MQTLPKFDLAPALVCACFIGFYGVLLILAGLYAPASLLEQIPKMGWVAKDNLATARAMLIGGGVVVILVAFFIPLLAFK